MKRLLFILITCILAFVTLYILFYYMKIKSYKKKTKWAICFDNQGMITHEIILNNDFTYYTKLFNKYYFGTYTFKDNIVHFNNFNDLNICEFYKLKNNSYLTPINCQLKNEDLIFIQQ